MMLFRSIYIMNAEAEKKAKEKFDWKAIKPSITVIGIFYVIAISLGILVHIFYFFNFMYIGSAIGITMVLMKLVSKKNRYKARQLCQLLIGGYIFIGIGCGLIFVFLSYISPENMQLEGFWFWLLSGSFAAGVLHYVIAKIFGPFIFNRGWCGWACWTAAVLDYLPWKKSPGRVPKIGVIRYVHFAISTVLVFLLVYGFNYTLSNTIGYVILNEVTVSPESTIYASLWQIPDFWWFILGNSFYYVIGIGLAVVFKDNRAFCKYICPITPFLKVGSKFALMKIEGDAENCTECRACERACPMDIRIVEYIQQGLRISSSECILCDGCIYACPDNLLKTTNKWDKRTPNYLHYRE